MAELSEGTMAPDFRLNGDDGKEHTLKEFKGKTLVLYFYPKDDTPGCTIEAKEFTAKGNDIRKLGAVVVGVSSDGYESHCEFRDKYGLKVLLISDPSNKMIKEYGAYGDKGVFGMGTIRTTYVIDKIGKIVKSYKRVNALGHADSVVEFLKSSK